MKWTNRFQRWFVHLRSGAPLYNRGMPSIAKSYESAKYDFAVERAIASASGYAVEKMPLPHTIALHAVCEWATRLFCGSMWLDHDVVIDEGGPEDPYVDAECARCGYQWPTRWF